ALERLRLVVLDALDRELRVRKQAGPELPGRLHAVRDQEPALDPEVRHFAEPWPELRRSLLDPVGAPPSRARRAGPGRARDNAARERAERHPVAAEWVLRPASPTTGWLLLRRRS